MTDKLHVNSPKRKAACATNTLRTRLVYDFLQRERLCFIEDNPKDEPLQVLWKTYPPLLR